MPIAHLLRFLAAALVSVALAACTVMDVGPDEPAGMRRWVVTVENLSQRAAILVVAEDTSPIGRVVGTSTPDVVPPGATVEVTFAVPPGRTWAIFVNPGRETGPLVTAADVPADAVGMMPFTIGVGADGEPFASVPGIPGWFGN